MTARGMFLRALRAPLNYTAFALGHLHGACSGSKFTWVELGEGLHGVLITTPTSDPKRVILYFHGGGHWLLNTAAFRELGSWIAAACGACLVLVEYTKAPAATFPKGLNQALQAYTWALANYNPGSIAVAGDSSGGNLAFALLVKLAQTEQVMPAAVIGISPWLRLDLSRSAGNAYGIWCADLYLGGKKKVTTVDDPLVTIVNASPELIRRFPPILMHAGRNELTTNDVKEMQELCEKAGHPAEVKFYACPHDFQLGALFPASTRDSLGLMGEFLQRHWKEDDVKCVANGTVEM